MLTVSGWMKLSKLILSIKLIGTISFYVNHDGCLELETLGMLLKSVAE